MTRGTQTDPGTLMRAEIAEQPGVYGRILAGDVGDIRDAHRAIARRSPRFVTIAARGSSDHAALYAKYLFETKAGLPVGLTSPSTYTVYDRHPVLADSLFLAVSQSGTSPDLVRSLAAARESGAFTVAVTNTPDSALALAANRHIYIDAGEERSVAATKTYTAELLALYLLIVPEPADLAPLPAAASAALTHTDEVAALAGRVGAARSVITTGRGFSYPSAREVALKLAETSYLPALAYSAADLMHGPLAMIDPDMPVIAIVAPGAAGRAMAPVCDSVRERGGAVLTVGYDRAADVALDRIGLDDAVLPMLEILPLQQMALTVALARGIDPDRPRGLHKVTRTN